MISQIGYTVENLLSISANAISLTTHFNRCRYLLYVDLPCYRPYIRRRYALMRGINSLFCSIFIIFINCSTPSDRSAADLESA